MFNKTYLNRVLPGWKGVQHVNRTVDTEPNKTTINQAGLITTQSAK